MRHCGTRRLETARLILRRFVPEDAPAMYENWASDPAVTKYLTWPPHESADATRRLLEAWAADYARPDCYQWAMVLKEGGGPIGSVSVVALREEIDAVSLGYCIGRRWWGRGLAAEALRAVLDFFFDQVGVNRAEARHDVRNPNSGRVMEKCGMRYEGTLRGAGRNNQGVCDLCCRAMLRSDRDGG